VSQPFGRFHGFHHHRKRLGPATLSLTQTLHSHFIRGINEELITAKTTNGNDLSRLDRANHRS
jgi:hypothetical protein